MFQLRVFAKIIVHQTALLPLLAFYPPSAYMLYICIYGEWQSELRKRWMVGGPLSATGRNRSIIYGGKILLCLVSHVKAHISYFSLLLVLFSRSHMEIPSEDQNPQSKGCFFDLLVDFVEEDVELKIYHILYHTFIITFHEIWAFFNFHFRVIGLGRHLIWQTILEDGQTEWKWVGLEGSVRKSYRNTAVVCTLRG